MPEAQSPQVTQDPKRQPEVKSGSSGSASNSTKVATPVAPVGTTPPTDRPVTSTSDKVDGKPSVSDKDKEKAKPTVSDKQPTVDDKLPPSPERTPINQDPVSKAPPKPVVQFGFEIKDGVVTGMTENVQSKVIPQKIEDNQQFVQLKDGAIVRQEVQKYGIELTVYKDLNGDGLYERVDQGYVAKKDLPPPSPSKDTTSSTTKPDISAGSAPSNPVNKSSPTDAVIKAVVSGQLEASASATGDASLPKIHKGWYEVKGKSSDFKLNLDQGTVQLSAANTSAPAADSSNTPSKTLDAPKRVMFDDKAVAFGTEAETVAKLLGAVFGKEAVANKQYAAIGLDLLDSGMSVANLAELAAKAAGLDDHPKIVAKLWSNLFHREGAVDELKPYVKMLDDGASVSSLVLLAANTDLNTNNINLVGIQQSGLEFGS